MPATERKDTNVKKKEGLKSQVLNSSKAMSKTLTKQDLKCMQYR